jgi:hypothetical protein
MELVVPQNTTATTAVAAPTKRRRQQCNSTADGNENDHIPCVMTLVPWGYRCEEVDEKA